MKVIQILLQKIAVIKMIILLKLSLKDKFYLKLNIKLEFLCLLKEGNLLLTRLLFTNKKEG